jgi:hypothetical protein
MWNAQFSAVNVIAFIGWILLIAFPRKPLTHSVILYLCVAMLCLIYGVTLALVMSGTVDPARISGAGETGFGSIEGVRAIFQSDGGVVIGWTHYLAFDLFTGMWIGRDGDHKSFSRWVQAAFLVLTYLFGPVGLFCWLVVRERRARATGRG